MIKKLLNRISWILEHMKENEQVILLRGEEIDTVKKALEKQNRLKPKDVGFDQEALSIEWNCPVCDYHHSASYTPPFCSSCGQAIDRSEEE